MLNGQFLSDIVDQLNPHYSIGGPKMARPEKEALLGRPLFASKDEMVFQSIRPETRWLDLSGSWAAIERHKSTGQCDINQSS